MINSETISAISTATGEAGIGIVRMSGDEAVNIANKIFKPIGKKKLIDAENRKMLYGHIYDEDKIIDEVLIVKMTGPHTYTREDVVEIYCHGGIIAVRNILKLTLKCGARLAEAGEFTKRAFLNGRLDLAQAEAVIDLIHSKSEVSYEMSIRQLEGSLSGHINKIRERVMAMTALIVANIDFPEDEIVEATYNSLKNDAQEVLKELDKLISNSNRGQLLRDGINTVILGKPNVGKSSMLNKLLRDERAIVTDIPGTTRDVITDYVNLDGILLKITDTAGIRDTKDKVEQIGVNRAKEAINDSDLIIAIFDGSKPFTEEDREIVSLIGDRKAIILLNKSDLERKVSDKDIKNLIGNRKYFDISILNGEEVEKIENEIKEMFFNGEIRESSEIYVNNLRHVNALKEARDAMQDVLNDIDREMFLDLLEINLESALAALGEITGDTTTEDILDKVFKEFCIGK